MDVGGESSDFLLVRKVPAINSTQQCVSAIHIPVIWAGVIHNLGSMTSPSRWLLRESSFLLGGS